MYPDTSSTANGSSITSAAAAVRTPARAAPSRRTACGSGAAGIESMTSFMHDFPQETEKDSEATLSLAEELCQLELNRQSHHFYTPYPMTELYAELEQQRRITETLKTQREWAETSTFWGSA